MFVLFALIPILAVGALGYVESLRALESLVASQTSLIAERIAVEVRDRRERLDANMALLADVETQRMLAAHATGDTAAERVAIAAARLPVRRAGGDGRGRGVDRVPRRERPGAAAARRYDADRTARRWRPSRASDATASPVRAPSWPASRFRRSFRRSCSTRASAAAAMSSSSTARRVVRCTIPSMSTPSPSRTRRGTRS